jgi:large subunit ribosomal protein L24
MSERIRRGDTVAVISGDDRGKRGRVLRVLPESDRVVVEGVNLVYKHLRKSQQNPTGGRVRKEAPIHACKVMPVDPQSNLPTRVAFRFEDGKKFRFGRRSGARIDAAPSKKETAKREAAARKASAKSKDAPKSKEEA